MDVLIADVPRSSDRDAPFMGDKSRASSSAMLAKDDDTQFSKHKFPPAFGYPKSSSHFSKIASPGITGKTDDKVPSTSGALPHHKRMDRTVEEGLQRSKSATVDKQHLPADISADPQSASSPLFNSTKTNSGSPGNFMRDSAANAQTDFSRKNPVTTTQPGVSRKDSKTAGQTVVSRKDPTTAAATDASSKDPTTATRAVGFRKDPTTTTHKKEPATAAQTGGPMKVPTTSPATSSEPSKILPVSSDPDFSTGRDRAKKSEPRQPSKLERNNKAGTDRASPVQKDEVRKSSSDIQLKDNRTGYQHQPQDGRQQKRSSKTGLSKPPGDLPANKYLDDPKGSATKVATQGPDNAHMSVTSPALPTQSLVAARSSLQKPAVKSLVTYPPPTANWPTEIAPDKIDPGVQAIVVPPKSTVEGATVATQWAPDEVEVTDVGRLYCYIYFS